MRSSAGGSGSPHWYQLPGGGGPATSALDVGAAAGHRRLRADPGHGGRDREGRDRRQVHGQRIDIQPTSAPSLVLSVSNIAVDPSLDGRSVASPPAAPGSGPCSTSRRSRSSRSRATRTTRATTCWSRCIRPRRSRSGELAGELGKTSFLKILFVGDVFGAPGRRGDRVAGSRRCATSSAWTSAS